ncbi:MAG TPA: 2TM domain-containing protein [Kofleriaceae bacterium]
MENDLETVAKKRVQARMGFVVHALIYFVMNAGFVAIWMLTGSGYPWFVWPALGWGIGLLAHGVALLIGPGSTAERRAIDREVHRLRAASR